MRNDNMALRVLPETKYWELAEYKFVTNNGDRIYHGTQRNRIAERHLQAHGAYAPDQATLQRLMYLVRRLDRDFLSYGNCSGPELKVFADARGIEYPQDRKRMKKEMVRALERADDDARFIRIMDLPAELRVRIYEYYCLDLGHWFGFGPGYVPLEHAQPPLTMVCRLMREESLKVFYDTCVLLVDFERTFNGSPIYPPLQLETDSRFLVAATVATIQFKHFHLRISTSGKRPSPVQSNCDLLNVLVDMPIIRSGIDNVSVEASWNEYQTCTVDEWCMERLSQAEKMTLAVAERVATGDLEWCPDGFNEMAGEFTKLMGAAADVPYKP